MRRAGAHVRLMVHSSVKSLLISVLASEPPKEVSVKKMFLLGIALISAGYCLLPFKFFSTVVFAVSFCYIVHELTSIK